MRVVLVERVTDRDGRCQWGVPKIRVPFGPHKYQVPGNIIYNLKGPMILRATPVSAIEAAKAKVVTVGVVQLKICKNNLVELTIRDNSSLCTEGTTSLGMSTNTVIARQA